MNMPIPRVKFIEQNEGFSPVRPTVTNRIGIIGPFSRGPANKLRLISGYTDFANTYGSDGAIGSLAFQSAWDQGARDFGCLRILGRGKSAVGKLDFSGYASKKNDMIFLMKFIGPATRRSERALRSNIMTSGDFTDGNSGRFWFKVDKIDDNDFIYIRYLFIADGQEGLINWNPVTRDPNSLPLDSTFPSNLANIVLGEASSQSSISSSVLQVVGAEKRTFNDSCLELGTANEVCAQAQIQGWRVIVEAGSMRWTYHIDNSGQTIRFDSSNSGYIGTIPITVPGTTQGTDSYNTAIWGQEITITTTGETSSKDAVLATTTTSGVIYPSVFHVEDYFVVNKDDTGIPFAVDKGLFLTFDTLNTGDGVDLSPGDIWSVRILSKEYNIPIHEEAVPSQVVTAFASVMSGEDPVGEIKRNDTDTGLLFELEPEWVGIEGNNWNYYLDLAEPDGEVVTEGSFFSGEKYIQVPIKFATYIQEGAQVTTLEKPGIYGVYNISNPFDVLSPTSNPNKPVISANTKVVRVEAPITGGGMAVIWLDKPIEMDFDSIAVFHFANPLGLSMTHYTQHQSAFMQGGEDPPRRATRTLYTLGGIPLIQIIANSEGQWGNQLRIGIYPESSRTIRITIRDLDSDNYDPPLQNEVFVISLDQTDDNGVLTQLNASKFIRGIFIPKATNPSFNIKYLTMSPMRLAPLDENVIDPDDPAYPSNYGPQYMSNFSLEDGYDGPPLNAEDYIQGLNMVKDEPVHMLVTPGLYNSRAVKAQMLAQAKNATEVEGMRIAILNARPGLTPEAAHNETFGFDDPHGVMVAGWGTYMGRVGAPRGGQSPDAYLAGKLAATPYFIGPNAKTSAGAVFGVAELDTMPYSGKGNLQRYTDARLEVLHLDRILNRFSFLNGRTLSTNTQWDKVSYRRTFNVIRTDLSKVMYPYLSEPNTPRNHTRMASAIDAYMSQRKRNGQISSASNASVSSPNPAAGLVEIRVSIIPIYAMDYIDIYLIRDDIGSPTRPLV